MLFSHHPGIRYFYYLIDPHIRVGFISLSRKELHDPLYFGSVKENRINSEHFVISVTSQFSRLPTFVLALPVALYGTTRYLIRESSPMIYIYAWKEWLMPSGTLQVHACAPDGSQFLNALE
jgi:hypothetical protein